MDSPEIVVDLPHGDEAPHLPGPTRGYNVWEEEGGRTSDEGEEVVVVVGEDSSHKEEPRTSFSSLRPTTRPSLDASQWTAPEDAFPVEEGKFLIKIQVDDPADLFMGCDPSPFHEKTLAPDVDSYITDCTESMPINNKAKVVVILPKECRNDPAIRDIPEGVRNYYKWRVVTQRRELRKTFAAGRVSFLVGIVFLVIFMLAAGTFQRVIATFWSPLFWITEPLAQALIVIGWVGMWEPVFLVLHTWRPMRKALKRFNRLAELDIEVSCTGQRRIHDDTEMPVSPAFDGYKTAYGLVVPPMFLPRLSPSPRLHSPAYFRT